MVTQYCGEMAALTLIWSRACGMEQDRLKWRGVQMDEGILKAVVELRKEGASQEIDLSALDVYREAA